METQIEPSFNVTLAHLAGRGWTPAIIRDLLDPTGALAEFPVAKVDEVEKSAAFRAAVIEAVSPIRVPKEAIRAYDQIRAGVRVALLPYADVVKFATNPSLSAYPNIEKYYAACPDVPKHQLILDVVVYHVSRVLTNAGKHLRCLDKTQGLTPLGKHARALVNDAIGYAYPEIKIAYRDPNAILIHQETGVQ